MTDKNLPLDIMSINHILIYIVIGLFIKNNYIFALCLGILWEIFEYNIANISYTRNLLELYWPVPVKYWDETNKFNPILDIVCNMIGYYIGNSIVLKI